MQSSIKKGITNIYQRSQRNKIILIFGNRIMLMTFNTDIIKINVSIDTRRQSKVFECLINMVPQDTNTGGYQTHNTIQNLKFGMYLFIVLIENTTELMMK